MSSKSKYLIETKNLKKYFAEDESLFGRLNPFKVIRTVKAVDGVDLQVEHGETLGLVGESGCGKSTLARTILRLLEPTSGSVYFEGENIVDFEGDDLKAFRKKAQMIFQDPFSSLNPRYTVRKTLAEPMKVHGIGNSKDERTQRAGQLLKQVGLNPEYLPRHPHEFSGGQRQRIAIARALAVEPDLIVADEPTSALDVSVQADILELLDDLKREKNLTMIFISHDLSVVRYVSDRMAVMYLGNIVEVGGTNEIFTNPKHPYTQSLLSSIPSPDPTKRSEFVPLEGSVPDPIDPPTGCRFHTRCPKIIPPEDWHDSQEAWHEVFNFKKAIEDGRIARNDVREYVETGQYDDYFDRRFDAALTEDIKQPLRDALDRFVDGGEADPNDLFPERFTSPCETDVPVDLDLDDRSSVKCHLYDPDQLGEPSERNIEGQTASSQFQAEGET